jgi:hypothetical protein
MHPVINVIVANGTITMSRVTGEFFVVIEICRVPRARARARVEEASTTVAIIWKCGYCGINAFDYQVRTVAPRCYRRTLRRLP